MGSSPSLWQRASSVAGRIASCCSSARAYKHRWVQPLNISFIRGQLTSFGAKAGITPCRRAGCTRSGILGMISGPVTLVAAAWAVFLQHRADNEAVACCEMTKPDVSCLCTAPGLFLSPPWRASPLGMRCSHLPRRSPLLYALQPDGGMWGQPFYQPGCSGGSCGDTAVFFLGPACSAAGATAAEPGLQTRSRLGAAGVSPRRAWPQELLEAGRKMKCTRDRHCCCSIFRSIIIKAGCLS